ncbi:hypothetical protein GCM10020254_76240 [Streptomyces goshikiensis]
MAQADVYAFDGLAAQHSLMHAQFPFDHVGQGGKGAACQLPFEFGGGGTRLAGDGLGVAQRGGQDFARGRTSTEAPRARSCAPVRVRPV